MMGKVRLVVIRNRVFDLSEVNNTNLDVSKNKSFIEFSDFRLLFFNDRDVSFCRETFETKKRIQRNLSGFLSVRQEKSTASIRVQGLQNNSSIMENHNICHLE